MTPNDRGYSYSILRYGSETLIIRWGRDGTTYTLIKEASPSRLIICLNGIRTATAGSSIRTHRVVTGR